MIELEIGKAIVAVEDDRTGHSCKVCCLQPVCIANRCGKGKCAFSLPCANGSRKDGKNVIFKIVDISMGKIMVEAV